MSRLDEELKSLFQRQEPSPDFSERLLARIQAEAEPKASLWQRLIAFFQPDMMRWAVAAAAVLLLAIIGFTQYQRLQKNPSDSHIAEQKQPGPSDEKVATPPGPQEKQNKPEDDRRKTDNEQKRMIAVGHSKARPAASQRRKFVKAPAAGDVLAEQQRTAGELAKEQLMKALSIASTTVNEARKLAMGSD